jgi:hypothetical protein
LPSSILFNIVGTTKRTIDDAWLAARRACIAEDSTSTTWFAAGPRGRVKGCGTCGKNRANSASSRYASASSTSVARNGRRTSRSVVIVIGCAN